MNASTYRYNLDVIKRSHQYYILKIVRTIYDISLPFLYNSVIPFCERGSYLLRIHHSVVNESESQSGETSECAIEPSKMTELSNYPNK